ncbi:MAG: ComEC/Rec2 family competence protein [Candidatus Acidiferrales bacterium]
MRSPVLALACAFALGIFLAGRTASGWWWLLGLTGVCLAVGLIAFARGRLRAAVALALVGFAFAGAAKARLFAQRFPSSDISHLRQWGFKPGTALQMEGTLLTNPFRTPYGLQFDLGVSRVVLAGCARRATGKARLRVSNARALTASGQPVNLQEGDFIRVRARLRRPLRYGNPGDFDYRHWLESIQDVTWQGAVSGRNSLKLLRSASPSRLSGLFGRMRQRLLASIDQLYPPWSVEGRDGAVLKAVLLGDRSSLDSSTIEDFRRSGLYHLLVVAGLHVGLLVLLAGLLLRAMGLREVWCSVLLLLFLGVYSGLVEERASTLRASLMIAAYLTARLFDRQQPALNAVGIAALILLFRRPAWLFDSGFQLSFTAALLIAALAVPILERLTEPYRRSLQHLRDVSWDVSFEPRAAQFRLEIRSLVDWLSARSGLLSAYPRTAVNAIAWPLRAGLWLLELAIFSAVIQLGLLLPMAEIFHRVTLAGIGLNTLAVPLMTLLLALAVPTVLLNLLFPPLAVLPSKALDIMMRGLLALTSLPRLPSWLSFRVPSPPGWVAWGFAISTVAAAFALWRRSRTLKFVVTFAAVFVLLIAWHPFAAQTSNGLLEITGLDCGGGESLLAVLPDRSAVLVGAGGGGRGQPGRDPVRIARWDPGANIVSPYLWRRGISSLGVLLVPDDRSSSLLGIASILRNFRVKELWSVPLPPYLAAPLFTLAHDRGARIRLLSSGETIEYHAFRFSVFWPPESKDSSSTGGLDSGLLMRISGAGGSVMLARDAGPAAVDTILNSSQPIGSAVLQYPRSQPAATFMNTVIGRIRPLVILGAGFTASGSKESDPKAVIGKSEALSPSGLGAVTITLKDGKATVSVYRPRSE